MIARPAFAAALLVALALPASAAAERRGYSITNFERLIVNGPFVVRVTTGRGSSGYAEGDPGAIRQIDVQVTGRTLRVRRAVSGTWGGYPGESGGSATLYLTTNEVDQVTVVGTGDVEIDRLEGGRVAANLGGNGRLAIGSIEADQASLAITGAGSIEAGGVVDSARVTVQGPGSLIASGLTADSLNVSLSGPGNVTVTAEREARIVASGNGNVTILGDAACTNRSVGSGEIVCGGLTR